MKLVWDHKIDGNNARNSEGSFVRMRDGGILYAYSRYCTADFGDYARSDIAVIRSFDEGETWSEPEIIVRAEQFGVKSVMSVSAVQQQNGMLGIYFMVKENAGNATLARALSEDGYHFTAERCETRGNICNYFINNDRFIRLQDGRLATAAAVAAFAESGNDFFSFSVGMISEDDGKTFTITPPRLTVPRLSDNGRGMQEPGIIQHKDGTIRLWARTREGWQYECFSRDNMQTFSMPAPSVFSSPESPLQMVQNDGVCYAIYNPIPQHNVRICHPAGWGRTPLVIRRSTDDGKTWGEFTVIEGEEDHGYCYPAVFFTKDDTMLCAYCRGGSPDEPCCLQRLGIMKIGLDEIK